MNVRDSAANARLNFRQQRNAKIRDNYKKPVTFEHLNPVVEQIEELKTQINNQTGIQLSTSQRMIKKKESSCRMSLPN